MISLGYLRNMTKTLRALVTDEKEAANVTSPNVAIEEVYVVEQIENSGTRNAFTTADHFRLLIEKDKEEHDSALAYLGRGLPEYQ